MEKGTMCGKRRDITIQYNIQGYYDCWEDANERVDIEAAELEREQRFHYHQTRFV